MTPEIINEKPRIELYLGDCLEILKTIPDKSIDLVLTDPPYGVLDGVSWDKKDYFCSSIKNWIKEMLRLARGGGNNVLCRKISTSYITKRGNFSKIAYLE